MHRLLIATNNKGKIRELRDLLKDTGIDLLTPAQINLNLNVMEDGNTYAENATKKRLPLPEPADSSHSQMTQAWKWTLSMARRVYILHAMAPLFLSPHFLRKWEEPEGG